MLLSGKSGIHKCQSVKGLEVERLSWIIRWALNAITNVFRRKVQREIWLQTEEKKPRDQRGKTWSDATPSQGPPAAARSWKRWGKDFPPETPEAAQLCCRPDFSSVMILHFLCAELGRIISVVLPPRLWSFVMAATSTNTDTNAHLFP